MCLISLLKDFYEANTVDKSGDWNHIAGFFVLFVMDGVVFNFK